MTHIVKTIDPTESRRMNELIELKELVITNALAHDKVIDTLQLREVE